MNFFYLSTAWQVTGPKQILLTAGQQPNMVSFEPILPYRNPEQPRQILQSVWSKNTWERLVLVSLGRKNDFRKPVILSPVELCLRRGWDKSILLDGRSTLVVGGVGCILLHLHY